MTREEIFRVVEEDTSIPPEILGALSRDKDNGVRRRVALNYSTPPEILLILMVDDNEYVRQKAEATLSKRVMRP